MLFQIMFVVLMVGCMKYSGGQGNFRRSHRDPTPKPVENKEVSRYTQHKEGEYKFKYRVEDGKGNMHYHAQHRSKSGVVRGCYGYTDVKGLYRIVEYIADEGGFRVKIHSDEPGIHRKEPAHVKMNVHSPLSGVGYSYAHPCVNLESTPEPEKKVTSEPTKTYIKPTYPPIEKKVTTPKTPDDPYEPWPEIDPTEKEVPPLPTDEELISWETEPTTESSTEEEFVTEIDTPPPLTGGSVVKPTSIGIQNFTKDPDKPGPPDYEIEFTSDCYCEVGGPGVETAKAAGLELQLVVPKQGVTVLSAENKVSAKIQKPDVTYPAECECGFVNRYKGRDGPSEIGDLKQPEGKKK